MKELNNCYMSIVGVGDSYYAFDENTYEIQKLNDKSKEIFEYLIENREWPKDNMSGRELIQIAMSIKKGNFFSENKKKYINGQNIESFVVSFPIQHKCNLRCKYCFADEGEYNGHKGVMSVETAKKAIDYVVKRSGPRRNIEIDLFGGEPTMIMDTIKEIIAYARENEKAWKKNIRFTMTTNATLLNEDMMDFMDKEMGNIILSLDGRKEVNDNVRIKVDGSGSYDDILPNIKRMIEKRDKSKHYYVRGTFTGANTDFYEDVKAMVNEGFREISIEPVVLEKGHFLELKEEHLPEIFENYDKLYNEMVRRKKEGDEFNFYHFNIDRS